MTKRSEHHTEYWIDGQYRQVEKFKYVDEATALLAKARTEVNPSRRDNGHGYSIYLCKTCQFWHVGRTPYNNGPIVNQRRLHKAFWAQLRRYTLTKAKAEGYLIRPVKTLDK